jgi:dipeptide transport system ATP-binding protein
VRPPLEGARGREARCHFPLDAAGRPTRGWQPEVKATPVDASQ